MTQTTFIDRLKDDALDLEEVFENLRVGTTRETAFLRQFYRSLSLHDQQVFKGFLLQISIDTTGRVLSALDDEYNSKLDNSATEQTSRSNLADLFDQKMGENTHFSLANNLSAAV